MLPPTTPPEVMVLRLVPLNFQKREYILPLKKKKKTGEDDDEEENRQQSVKSTTPNNNNNNNNNNTLRKKDIRIIKKKKRVRPLSSSLERVRTRGLNELARNSLLDNYYYDELKKKKAAEAEEEKEEEETLLTSPLPMEEPEEESTTPRLHRNNTLDSDVSRIKKGWQCINPECREIQDGIFDWWRCRPEVRGMLLQNLKDGQHGLLFLFLKTIYF